MAKSFVRSSSPIVLSVELEGLARMLHTAHAIKVRKHTPIKYFISPSIVDFAHQPSVGYSYRRKALLRHSLYGNMPSKPETAEDRFRLSEREKDARLARVRSRLAISTSTDIRPARAGVWSWALLIVLVVVAAWGRMHFGVTR